jgi:hypothetical protein
MDREIHRPSPEEGRREVAPARSPKARTAGEPWMKGVEGAPRE